MNAHAEVKELIAWLQNRAGLTETETAWLAGVTQRTIHNITSAETGKYRVSADMLERLRYIKQSIAGALERGEYDPALLPNAHRPGSVAERRAVIQSIVK